MPCWSRIPVVPMVSPQSARGGSGQEPTAVRPGASGAVMAQASQALAGFALVTMAARTLDLAELGKFSILYAVIIMATAVSSGFVGDSLTVLDRRWRPVRAGLQRTAFVIAIGAGGVTATAMVVTGFLGLIESMLLAVAMIVYMLEDICRRLLMANLAFKRIVAVDFAALAGMGVTLAGWAVYGRLGGSDGSRAQLGDGFVLSTFLSALTIGQLAAIIVAVVLLPREESYLGAGPAAYREIIRYGRWRAAQQLLRPSLMALVRIGVMSIVALAAAGELEIARVYAAPGMILVGGISSYLFASFAGQRAVAPAELLRQADRGVAVLLGLAIPAGLVALWILPWAGPLVTGSSPNTLAVAGWILYAVSTAAVTPYGALGAIRSNPAYVFTIRGIDTVVSLLCAMAVLMLTENYALAPATMVLGSVLGGVALRILVRRNARRHEHMYKDERMPHTAAMTMGGVSHPSTREAGGSRQWT